VTWTSLTFLAFCRSCWHPQLHHSLNIESCAYWSCPVSLYIYDSVTCASPCQIGRAILATIHSFRLEPYNQNLARSVWTPFAFPGKQAKPNSWGVHRGDLYGTRTLIQDSAVLLAGSSRYRLLSTSRDRLSSTIEYHYSSPYVDTCYVWVSEPRLTRCVIFLYQCCSLSHSPTMSTLKRKE
jgi:hypothetical protein